MSWNKPVIEEDTFKGDFLNALFLSPVYRKPREAYTAEELAELDAKREGRGWSRKKELFWAWVGVIFAGAVILGGLWFVMANSSVVSNVTMLVLFGGALFIRWIRGRMEKKNANE